MNDDKPESTSEIAEGLPPVPIHDNRLESTSDNLRVNEPSAMQVFFAWEFMRVICHLPVIAIFAGLFATKQKIAGGAQGVIVAWLLSNIFFCVGPVGENYLCWYGIPRRFARFSMLLVIVVSTSCSLWALSRSSGWSTSESRAGRLQTRSNK